MDKEIALTCFDYNITGASFYIGSACLYFISFEFFIRWLIVHLLNYKKKKIRSLYFAKNQKCQLPYLDTFVQKFSVEYAIAQSVKWLHTIWEVCDSISTIVIILDLLFVYSLQYILMKMALHNCLHGHEATYKYCFILICFMFYGIEMAFIYCEWILNNNS
jgi:hypothetical protein